MSERLTTLRCSGCGTDAPEDEALPFRCPNAGSGDVDHVMRRELVVERAHAGPSWHETFLDSMPNPFIRYRRLLHSFNVAMSRGMEEHEFLGIIRALDTALEAVAGVGFVESPFVAHEALNRAIGRSSGTVWVKDETNNVSGSHKARHLAGIELWLEVVRRTGLSAEDLDVRRLAIASCGNAALAAAMVAKAAGRAIDVYIPTDAHPGVTERLEELGASLSVCSRVEGVAGDPCIHGFHEALVQGALPFSVQGNENGLTLEGGMTLGWEIVSVLLRKEESIDRIFIQVGGGALASSCAQALREAVSLGVMPSMPKVHAVQTKGGYPLRRAWELVVRHLTGCTAPVHPEDDAQLADRVAERSRADERSGVIRYAAEHRSEFMWPWESTPQSAAHGILDDETYDWLAIVEAMLHTGGYPVVVPEEDILEANAVAKRATKAAVDPTGTAGLAGLLRLVRRGVISDEESVAVLFTGRER